jgi:hypothetical protein
MAEAIKYEAAKHKFACGNDFSNLSVINFLGPGGSKACAYSCNMNLDLDGEPQAYGPLSKPKLRPKDNLGNAGWKREMDNAAIKSRYEAGKKLLSELEQKKVDLIAKTKVVPNPTKPAPVSAKVGADPSMVALDQQITHKKEELRRLSFEHIDANGNSSTKNPKNFEKIFWKWYGVAALTPGDAKVAHPYLEMTAPTVTLRKPVLDETSYYEDVFGRFPVVQSVFEPGPGYFVTPLPRAANPRFPSWDQRFFLPYDAFAQAPFGALAVPLGTATGLHLSDTVFAVRLDTTDTLSFHFRDTGFGDKVAECSFAAFTGLGGVYHPEKEGAAKFPNDFLLLYLAFPGGQTPASTLAKFATASNASDFPIILSFIAQTTADAKAKASKVVSGDPLKAFEIWKKSSSTVKPTYFDIIVQGLSNAGSDFVERMMRMHPSLLSEGLLLQPPTKP